MRPYQKHPCCEISPLTENFVAALINDVLDFLQTSRAESSPQKVRSEVPCHVSVSFIHAEVITLPMCFTGIYLLLNAVDQCNIRISRLCSEMHSSGSGAWSLVHKGTLLGIGSWCHPPNGGFGRLPLTHTIPGQGPEVGTTRNWC